jgi:hypothetical protein
MPKVQSPACAGCGAPLGPWEQNGHVRCAFCGRDNFIQQQQQMAPPRPPGAPNAAAGAVIALAVGGVVLTAGIGVAVSVFSSVTSGTSFSIGDGSGPGAGGVVPAGEHMQWGGGRNTVLPVAIDDDGVEDFVGMYRLFDGSEQRMAIGGFDGKTLERKWKSAELGTLSQNGYTMRMGLAGRRVVVTDSRYTAHVIEVATGKEVGAVQLSDQPRNMCSEGTGGSRVWIEVADKRNVLVDVSTAKATVTPARPSFCPKAEGDACESASVPCLDEDAAPKTEGLSVRTVLIDGDLGVAVGHKTPGTPVPTLQGFDAKTKTARWSATIAPDALAMSTGMDTPVDLMGGRIYTVYGQVSKGYHLVAFDARTGARTWDVLIPRSESGSDPDQIVVTPKRIYVPHWTWLDVFETAQGKHVGTVGMW